MGTHGGMYAEETVASIIRANVQARFGDTFEVRQNEWLKELKKEPDISIWAGLGDAKELRTVVEIKTVLDRSQWTDVMEQRAKYLSWCSKIDFRLIALRATALTPEIRKEIENAPWACVLWEKSGGGAYLRESEIRIWKPIEDSLEAAIECLEGNA